MIPPLDPSTGNLPPGEHPATWDQFMYGGELFVADWQADEVGTVFREFFQSDRDGNLKGIVVIELKDLT